MSVRRIYFTTRPALRVLYFEVRPLLRRIQFTTGARKETIFFQTGGPTKKKLFFSTAPGKKVLHFFVAPQEKNLLTTTLSADGCSLVVALSSKFTGKGYQLLARSQNGQTLEVSPDKGQRTFYQFTLPVGEDGVWFLSVTTGRKLGGVLASGVALVNYRSLKTLSRLAKKTPRCSSAQFELLEYYCGQAIVLFQASEFAACQQMLDLIRDLYCTC